MAAMQTATIELTGDRLEPDDVVAVARHGVPARLSDEARAAMEASAAVVERLAESEEPVYGVSTGFGSLAGTWIPPGRREELQRALIRSHAAGMGPPVEREVVRAMLFLRARSLAMGRSGARPVVADTMLALLAAGLDPVVPEHGSLGASGDLAPLAHCGLALIGEGEVWVATGERLPAAEALAAASIDPLTLTAKEGLALINGTDGILGMLLLALHDLAGLLKAADVTAAMSTEALLGTDRAFAGDLVALRPQPGQGRSAGNLTRLLAGSEIVASHRHDDPRVQDAYSLRCAPQVNGAARDTWFHVRDVAGAELRSAIDNPMVLPDGRVESCGNFHGAPVAFGCDFLAIAAAEVGAIAERRTDRLLDPSRSYGLPPFLTEDAGVNSGLMLAHYTQAAMVAENRRLAVPASTDSLPTSAMQEDHVSMGWGAARKLRTVVANVRRILAVELTCAARALDLRAPLRPGPGTAAALAAVRGAVPGAGPDRWLSPELADAEELVGSGAVVEAVEAEIGSLE
jgi:histidine ammonia-lyase